MTDQADAPDLAATASTSSLGDTLASSDSAAGKNKAAAAERGLLIGRYIVIKQLGAGAMGVVFTAFDPELDRKVALKLLKHRGGDIESARQRLRREAQSLAKLHHPNVVGVHDVGVHAGQLFVAMEFVEGQTLGEWMGEVEAPRPWQEVLEVFMAAARGLAAAHETGLIHRDFKPDNVMLGVDGRVRVMDFGLARGGDDDPDGAASEESDSLEGMRAPVGKLTQTGAMLGTPAYMSFEQFEAGEVDARSDQFGFCVTLYEALYGERPFAGETLANLLRALRDEKILPAPEGAKVPGWLREVVVRGLAKDPGGRFASMQALLEALADDPVAKRRQRATRAGIAAALVGSVIGLGFLGSTVADQRAEITQNQEDLEEQNKQLLAREQQLLDREKQLETEIDTQKGLRASMLAGSPGNELAALRLAVDAIGDLDAELPGPVFTGLVGSVMGVEAGLVLSGHEDKVVAVAVHPDGSQIATASFDKTVRLWDANSGSLLQTLEGHEGQVRAVVFSRDGSQLATASGDKTTRIWDVATGKEIAKLAHEGELFGVAFSSDRDRVATAGGDGKVRVWDVAKSEEVFAVSHDEAARAVAWSLDGERLASASLDGTARVWSASDGAAVTSFAGHSGEKVHAVAWSPDGARVISGAEDGVARMWDATSGEELAVFDHGESVQALAFSANGEYLASGTFDDDSAHVWEVESAGRIRSFRHAGPVMGVAWSPDGMKLATASWDKTGKSWEVRASGALRVLEGHRQGVYAVAVSPDGTRIASGSGDDTARLWDARTGAVVAELRGHIHDLSAVSFSADGSMLATASWDAAARLWDGRSGVFLRALRGHTGRVNAVAFSSDGSRVATASADQTVRVWDTATGEELRTVSHETGVADVVFSPDGAQLLTVTSVNTAHLWASATGEALALGFSGPVTAAAFSPDGGALALATKGHVVQLWDPQSNTAVKTFAGHSGPVHALAFSTDGTLLATASNDGSARIWDVADDDPERGLLSHEGPVFDVAFTADGAGLVTASGDMAARVWALAPEPWLAWGCAMLESRGAQQDETRAVCASAPGEEIAMAKTLAEPTLVDGDGPQYEVIVEHGVEFVLVPGGTFMMGSPEGEGDPDEHPQREVTLDGFYMARTELTNAQYGVYRDANPDVEKPAGWGDTRFDQPQQPVAGLSWYDAQAYCDWAGCSLPTEAQWEYAARAGTTTAYWYGDELGELDRFGWFVANSGDRPHSVATKGANAFGLCDMAGNLYEWTLDNYGDYTTSPRSGDGSRHKPVGDADRVIRGGSWSYLGRGARSAVRSRVDPGDRINGVGFRPLRAIP